MGSKSTSSKWEIFGALYKHGSSIEALQKALPKWSKETIESYVKSYRGRATRKIKAARKTDISKDEPIDMWYDYIDNCHQIEGTGRQTYSKIRRNRSTPVETNNDHSFLLSKSMMYAACFEEHYKGESPDDPNYNEIYRYLAQLLAGAEPTQLRPGNAAKIMEMMSNLKELLDGKDNVQRYLNYLTERHTVSFVDLGIDPIAVAEKKRKEFEIDDGADQEYQKFLRLNPMDEMKMSNLDPNDPQYNQKREKIILKLSLGQRALGSTLLNIPGLNPLEMIPPSLVKPPHAITKYTPTGTYKRQRRVENTDDGSSQ